MLAIPHYCFDLHDGNDTGIDNEGIDLPDDLAARHKASRAMGDLARERFPVDEAQANITMLVRGGDGAALLQIALSYSVKVIDSSGL